jgi:hypothetical protein
MVRVKIKNHFSRGDAEAQRKSKSTEGGASRRKAKKHFLAQSRQGAKKANGNSGYRAETSVLRLRHIGATAQVAKATPRQATARRKPTAKSVFWALRADIKNHKVNDFAALCLPSSGLWTQAVLSSFPLLSSVRSGFTQGNRVVPKSSFSTISDHTTTKT